MGKKKPEPEPKPEIDPQLTELTGVAVPKEIPQKEPEPETEKEPGTPVTCYRCNHEFDHTDTVLATGLYTDNKPCVRVFHKNCAIHAYARNGWGALFEV